MSSALARRVIRGIYAVTPDETDTDALVRKVGAAIDGGVQVIQYRNKTAPHALRLDQARALQTLCATRGAALIVNDHVDIAIAVNADGLHLGKEDGAARLGREALGPQKLLGISCYDSFDRALEAQRNGADHVAFGSFFPSRVKPGAARASLELLARAKRELELPVVAIGGITLDNAAQLISAGAASLAVISALFEATDIAAAAADFAALFERQA